MKKNETAIRLSKNENKNNKNPKSGKLFLNQKSDMSDLFLTFQVLSTRLQLCICKVQIDKF